MVGEPRGGAQHQLQPAMVVVWPAPEARQRGSAAGGLVLALIIDNYFVHKITLKLAAAAAAITTLAII